MELTDKNILLISPEPWGTNFVSKHHFANTLAERGNYVFFLNPPGPKNEIVKIHKNLSTINYKPFLKGINRLPLTIRSLFALDDVKRITKFTGQLDIVWSFDPYRFQNLKLFKAKTSIFHPVDIHKNKKLVSQTYYHADIVLAPSEKILSEVKSKTPKYKINHGLNKAFSTYKFVYNKPTEVVKVGYVGNLHYQYIDKKVLQNIIREHPDIEFHFIGPFEHSNLSKILINTDLTDFLTKQKNCKLYGAIPSEKLPNIINKFHLFLMCYIGDRKVAEMSNSHKVLEYFATGNVVVSHYMDEYKDKRYLLEMVESNDLLPAKFKEVIQNLPKYNSADKQEARIAWALQNSYDRQINKIEKILSNI